MSDTIFDIGLMSESKREPKKVKLSDKNVLIVIKDEAGVNAGRLVIDVTDEILEEYVMSDEELNDLGNEDDEEVIERRRDSDRMKIKKGYIYVDNFDKAINGWGFNTIHEDNVKPYPHPTKIYEQIINEE